MADLRKSVVENVPGEFFVDSTCIDCDACRQIAPATFGAAAGRSYVRRQPDSLTERRDALHALLSCPTGSIGTTGTDRAVATFGDFPLPIHGPVSLCGFNSHKSFGGNSYFVTHPEGNWLIDSPRFLTPLVKQLESLGGVQRIFLTHRDDVADAARYARHFQAPRIIHRDDLDAQPDAEIVLMSDDPIELSPGFEVIPTPGHTRGHCCLLFENRYLFTGDHLSWDRDAQMLDAAQDYCWHSWEQQQASLHRLASYTFEWILPGHGQRVWLPGGAMQSELVRLLGRLGVS